MLHYNAINTKTLALLKAIQQTENINIYTVDNIKVDVVNYQYPWLKPQLVREGLRLAALPDIAAMKLAAITGRGSKKDFVDIYFLLKHHTFEELLSFYNNKYQDGSTFLVLRSLTYFEDADIELMPKMFENISWDAVKKNITKSLKEYVFKN